MELEADVEDITISVFGETDHFTDSSSIGEDNN